jgi:hypothetical protein
VADTKGLKKPGVRKQSLVSGVLERESEVLDKTEQQDLSAKKVGRNINGSLSKTSQSIKYEG